jgi:dipeptidyl aminopeptidase/acylaminoacyl peptidase
MANAVSAPGAAPTAALGPPPQSQGNLPLTLLLGGPAEDKLELARLASPLRYVAAGAPPFLLLHGSDDPLVSPEQSERLYRALMEVGTEAELYIIAGAGHGTLEFAQPEIQRLMLAFLNKHV